MKKRLSITMFFMLLCSFVFGQHWEVEQEELYYKNMSVFAEIQINGEPQLRTDIEIAAFHKGVVRGTANPQYNKKLDKYIVAIGIYGVTEGEIINFKIFDPTAGTEGKEFDTDFTVEFYEDDVIGSVTNLTPIDFYEKHWSYDENLDNYMSIVSTIMIDGVVQNRTNLEIAAFCGEEVRGVARPEFWAGPNIYIITLKVDGKNKDKISFKLYDPTLDKELLTDYTVEYLSNSMVGDEEPLSINFLTPYIAKIGEIKYETLQAAVDAYEGETITMIKNAQCETAVTIDENLTIDFAGFTYDGALDLNATLNVVGTAGKVTSIVLNEGAQVYHSYALETTIVRNIEGTASGWGTLSAPTATGNVVFNTTGRHDFYKYEESANLEWVFVDVEENAYTMQPGRGYLYANKEDVVASFTGALNMDDVNYVLSCTDKETDKELSGLNMIGNPFTHNINVNHLDGEIAEAFYSVATNGAWVPNVEESIAPLQAVLVQTDAKGTLTIKKTATRERGVSEGSLKINVANKNYNDVAYVLFEEGLGLSKIAHFNTEIPMVSVNVEGKEYAVATMNKEVTEIPVSFKAMTMGEYTISVEAQDVEETIYLTDKLTGERVNLNTDSYTFMATSNDNTDRFVLTKVLDTTGIEQNAEYSVYVSNDEIRFNNLNGNLNVRIYDMLGRPVAEYNVFESATISTSSFETGMYIIQMTDENGVRTQKVLVD